MALFLPGPGPLVNPTPHGFPVDAVPTDLDLSADTGTASADGGTVGLTVTLAVDTGTATAGGGTSALTVGLAATAGTATTGGTVAFSETLTATGGTATAGGGAVAFAETLTAASGTATAGGGTVSLTVVLAATGGTATAGGGDASVSVVVAPLAIIVGPGLTPGIVRAATRPPPPTRLQRVSTILSGFTLSTALDLTATGGTATAGGGTVSLAVTVAATGGAATAAGGTVALTAALTATSGAATAGGGANSLTVTLAATGGTASADGGDASLSIITGPAVAYIIGPGRPIGTVRAVTRPPAPVRLQRTSSILSGFVTTPSVDLSATGGTASADGGTVTLTIIGAGIAPYVVFAGGTYGIVRAARKPVPYQAPPLLSRVIMAAEAPTAPSATADGGTVGLRFTYTASGGTATAGGGTVTVFVPGTSDRFIRQTRTPSGGFTYAGRDDGPDWTRVTSTADPFGRSARAAGGGFIRVTDEADEGFVKV